MKDKWKDFVYQNVVEFCNKIGSRTFSLGDFTKQNLEIFQNFKPDNHHVEAKIRQQLQLLRDDGKISFLDNSGHYTLRGVDLLDAEAEETRAIDISGEKPERKEYIVETYVRKVAWAELAKKKLGEYCLCASCTNTFLREDRSRYIEVHHIVPLCEGGEDGVWNLSVLCAHHHRMAHFARKDDRANIRSYLLGEVARRLV